ncbi:NmrA family NAD(P)-binding protein [Lentzea sp. JNUCC 0626]|uniref:NmrA family NAD(P)-binding protein n=1 Tax=Lentzea sp. JNUCC 0626 TaxID=3367513 RepID=UPI00374857B9
MTDVVVVTGATGQQGGAVARRLLADGVPVRALVRRPEAAQALADAGAELVKGDLTDSESLVAALRGARAVFSVQTPSLADLGSNAEAVMGLNLVAAARRAGVAQFVHSSVSGVGDYLRAAAVGQAGRRGDPHYWLSKAVVGQALPDSGFEAWTELRPAFFATNLRRPSIWFEHGTGEAIVTALDPDKPQAVIVPDDIGTAAAAAFADPARFHGHAIELAGELLSLRDMAEALTAAGTPAHVEHVTVEQGEARGMLPLLLANQAGMNTSEISADPAVAARFGIPMTSFADWAKQQNVH